MSIENILKKRQVTNTDLYDCCSILFKKYLSDDNELLFCSIKYIKYDKFFCNKVNKLLKKKNLDDKTLIRTIKYNIYVYIYRKLLQFIYLYEQDMYEQGIYEQDIYEDFWNKIVSGAKNLGKKIESGAKDLGKKIESGAKDVGKKIEKGAKDVGKKIEKGAKDVGNKLLSVAKDTVIGIGDKMIGYANKLNDSRKCLQSGDLNCAFKNIKDIATDVVPAINVIDKLARGQKVTAEDMIMLAISVAPVPGGAIVGSVAGTVGKVVVKSVVKSVAKAVVKNVMHDPKVNARVSNVVDQAMKRNKNIKPEELKKIVAAEIDKITIDETNKLENKVNNRMIYYVNQINGIRKCLTELKNRVCILGIINSINDIASSNELPAMNVINKQTKNQKVTNEDLIILALSVIPKKGTTFYLGRSPKYVDENTIIAVVENIIYNPNMISGIINSSTEPETLKEIIANNIKQNTLDEINNPGKSKRERAEKERAERERAERERAARKRAMRAERERERAAIERERAARKIATRERAARERAAIERATKERAARDRAARRRK